MITNLVRRAALAGTAALASLMLLAQLPAAVAAPGHPARPAHPGHPARPPSRTKDPGQPPNALGNQLTRQLGRGWWRGNDFIITSSGDSAGMHYYIARESDGYYWRPLASILPAGSDAGSWTGYFCVSGDNRYVLATLAPTLAGNYPNLEDRGALAYVITIANGQVRPLTAGVAMYYDVPGCGVGDRAILTAFPGSNEARTDVVTASLTQAKVLRRQLVPAQFTSAVPMGNGIAAYSHGAIDFLSPSPSPSPGPGAIRRLTPVTGAAYDLAPTANGGLDYLTTTYGRSAQAWHLTGVAGSQPSRPSLVATGARELLQLTPGRNGHNILTGITPDPATRNRARAAGLTVFAAKAKPSPDTTGVSRTGLVTETLTTQGKGAARLHPVPMLTSAVTGTTLNRPLPPPAPPTTGGTRLPTPLDDPVDPNANTTKPVCAVPRLDPRRQVLQPNHQQLEWAVDLAVRNQLTVSRQANYDNMGLPAYSPDGDIPAPALAGGGHIPAQIMLGVMAQESNFWQASWHALPGIAGDPLVADYYGAGLNGINVINYNNSDCGYGVGQVTTGMTFSTSSYWGGPDVQAKIAVDYAENIAAAVDLLSLKWNQLASYANPILANDGSTKYTANWYMALWAYNSGLDPQASTGNTTGCTPGPNCTDGAGNWGLGWTNNPEDTDWKPNRSPFLENSYADAAHPQDWPYQEKVLGFSAVPLLDYTGAPSYTPTTGYPPIAPFPTFCTNADNCDTTTANNCTLANYHCWWHWPATWINCAGTAACPQGIYTYGPGDAEPAVNDPHPPDCNSTLPANAVIVPTEPANYNLVGCGNVNWTGQGSFALTQGTNSAGVPISIIDTHQLGAGFGGHIWFTHNYAASDAEHQVTGTWTDSLPNHAYHVLVHIPTTGGTTTSANYQILTADGSTSNVTVNQFLQQDQWVGIGYYQLGANASVSLTNVTQDGSLGDHDVAFDAVAFVPVPGTAENHTFDAVSLFDWNQGMNTPTPSQINTPARTMKTLHDWAIDYGDEGPMWNNPANYHYGVASQPECPNLSQITAACVPADVWNVGSTWASNATAAGSTRSTSPTPVMTEPTWLAFKNPTPGPTTLGPSSYSADGSYKIKTHIEVSFVVKANGTGIVPGSEQVITTVRTGDTHMPAFVSGFMNAMQQDYGVKVPNLQYDEMDANSFTGDTTPVDPLGTGDLPGRAMIWHSDQGVITPDGACVGVRATSGGTIGWRPADAQTSVTASVADWLTRIQNNNSINQAVQDMAGEIYNFFFHGGLTGSIFNEAPPIWQVAHFKVCVNGGISSTAKQPNTDDTPADTLVDQSYMPDLYLYYDGQLVDNNGDATTTPVQLGDFRQFSNADFDPSLGTPYDTCDTGIDGNGGNPWSVTVTDPADLVPTGGVFCDYPKETFGSPYIGG